MLEIIKHPNKILRQKSKPIDIDKIKELQDLIKEMTETMFEKDGAGLAAPQIGKNIRLVIINQNDQAVVMINPEITKKSWAREVDQEGCLSVVNDKNEIYYLPVSRHKKVNCQYFNEAGEKKKIKAENLLARVLQHEIDHLDGILFIDKTVSNDQ